jgi:hypothetical protein
VTRVREISDADDQYSTAMLDVQRLVVPGGGVSLRVQSTTVDGA